MPHNNFSPRVSLVSGVVHLGDAISETLLADLDAIDRLSRLRRWNIDARVYCASATAEDARLQVFNDWKQVLRQPHFQQSDLYIYHYGIYSPMHDTMHFARRDASVMTFFHNVTPPQYCKGDAEELLHRSFQQIETLRCADVRLSASSFSADQLSLFLGKPVEVVPLFGPNASLCPIVKSTANDPEAPLRILYCGRFTQSKGAAILLEALAQLRTSADRKIDVTLVGITDFSDPEYIDNIRLMAGYLPNNVEVQFLPNMAAEQLRNAYERADVFVLPSFHEGFGMPAVEALSYGTPVICSNAGALAEVTNGLALGFAAGDSNALAQQLDRFADAHLRGNVLCNLGELPRAAWERSATTYAVTYTRDAYIERITPRITGLLDAARPSSRSYLTKLEQLASELFGQSEERPAADDAAVIGATRALEVADLAGRDFEQALRALLRWPFAREQNREDLAYWSDEIERFGIQHMTKRLGDAREVRESPARLQIGAFLQSILTNANFALEADKLAAPSERTLDIDHPDITLLLNSTIPVSEFIREAYRLILQRDPDPQGFGLRFLALNSGSLSRRTVIEEILASTEYASLLAAA